jgi:acetolactate synthase-1/2/3 large subunit
MTSISEELVSQLVSRGVDTVFGIPGVHTIELYRGLASSGIRHITPRHEQGAGFMADGYARVSGRPGVAFVITGPGLTNTLTAMGQARADSVPMLVVSGVNALSTLGQGMGHLHELPNQQAMAATVALESIRIQTAGDLIPALDLAYDCFSSKRPGPVHIEVPLDIAGTSYDSRVVATPAIASSPIDSRLIAQASEMLQAAEHPIILAGGGVRYQSRAVRALAETLDAPVVQTINARGLLYQHPLGVPACASLQAVRDLIEAADVVLALGTELGATDYDIDESGGIAEMQKLIRVDICEAQLARRPAQLSIIGDAADAIEQLNTEITTPALEGRGHERAAKARYDAKLEMNADMLMLSDLLNALRDTVPNAVMVGDSAQPIYAGNYYYDHDRPGGWFNAATGFGALGYAIPAAIGAAIADPDAKIICIAGDGGAQFSLPELMSAKDENLSILFIIWNNSGYKEIKTWMIEAEVTVVGCDPSPPDFSAVAASCFIPYYKCLPEVDELKRAVLDAMIKPGPAVLEIVD